MSLLSRERTAFHKEMIRSELLCFSHASEKHSRMHKVDNISCIADVGNRASVKIANLLTQKVAEAVGKTVSKKAKKTEGQSAGDQFEIQCKKFLEATFFETQNLRPGNWVISKDSNFLGNYEQFSHLLELQKLMLNNNELKSFLGDGYTIKPDIVIARTPETDAEINKVQTIVDQKIATKTPIRSANHKQPACPELIMHASVSCKFTMRSDRAQNTRTEALNLIRSRKGRVPHIVAVTAEPMAGRIASLALGTGDMDCIYHFALDELRSAYLELELDDAKDTLDAMIEGKRLRDISDLPLDLTI
ncbi:Type-2 restriction enzyme NgoMIV [Pseudovibrio sp. Ad5]|uniref:NgoMIV family type II restriction endonuclease n=1 Tax=Pseudovibrio sp. Ad5 TaxID=989436 RepID=UPI0007B2D290|nr:NgoMIV family type II restriction endonuclease [Pseudovibrio sp. Ad5]KZK96351.1 Type-2 restriction enzyme NgoMIV [Pseudovibrio sp. Ad5]